MAKLTNNQKEIFDRLSAGLFAETTERTMASLERKGFINSYKLERVQILGDFILKQFSAELV